MALYAIGDLHLSLTADKSMEVFGGSWEGYVDKLQAGFSGVSEEDTVVLCGDLSWGMSLEEIGTGMGHTRQNSAALLLNVLPCPGIESRASFEVSHARNSSSLAAVSS